MTHFNFSAANLSRYPTKHAKDLQAWDAADEYLAQFIPSNADVLILNDSFGGIDCAVRARESSPIHINDSWCSLKAIEINSHNSPMMFIVQIAHCALVKLPKSISLLEAQLKYLANQLSQPLEIYFSGMQKHVSSGHLDLLKLLCADLQYLPTERKARMYKGVLKPAKHQTQVSCLRIPELDLTLHNAAGVFAEQKLDIGSRFFIENFKLLPNAKTVADVGCGNGLLSLAYHQLHPEAALNLVDESLAAVESARLSFSFNFPEANYQVTHNDGLLGFEQVFDLILINPPFHQQNTVTTDIAMSMFAQAKSCMVPSSELWIVANRHLNYQADLKRWFRNVHAAAQNAKFVIIRAKL
jgi:23S rRNA (guanine1835-N2)-methyltransferase